MTKSLFANTLEDQAAPPLLPFVARPASVLELRERERSVARALVSTWEDGVIVYCVYVHPDFRRRGLARQLMRRVLDGYNLVTVYLQPEPWADRPMDAEALRSFYQSFGFADVKGRDGLMRLAER